MNTATSTHTYDTVIGIDLASFDGTRANALGSLSESLDVRNVHGRGQYIEVTVRHDAAWLWAADLAVLADEIRAMLPGADVSPWTPREVRA